jgi:Kef-type K+ transport system membrane component KefB
MTLQTLTLVLVIGLLGPLLAMPRRLGIPVVVGELAAGIAFGPTGANTLHSGNTTFTFLADVGFAMVMFVAGSHVPVRDPRLQKALRGGVARALGVAAVAVVLALLIAHVFDTGHAALYAVLMASSSAALALPIIDGAGASGPQVISLLPQLALADAACIIALPLAIDPHHARRAALGSVVVLATGAALFGMLWFVERRGYRRRMHELSEKRKFALELRISLAVLCALAALAIRVHVSIMLAGFSFGLAVAAVGEPRRLTRQLFAVTEGLFGPLFFVWVGSSLNLRELGDHPKFIALGAALGAGALVSHLSMRIFGQPLALGTAAAGQLGVPAAAVAVGTQLHLFHAGEAAAVVLGALITITAVTLVAGRLPRDTTAAETAPAEVAPR